MYSTFTTSKTRRGMTLMEMWISMAIISLLMLIMIPTMIYMARVFKGLHSENEYHKDLNYFLQVMEMDMTKTYEVTYEDPTKITYLSLSSDYAVDTESATGFVYNQERRKVTMTYQDDDNDPFTTKNNYLEYKQEFFDIDGNVIDTRTDVLLRNLSPMYAEDGTVLPIFTNRNSEAARKFVQFQAKYGDRHQQHSVKTISAIREKRYDDALTGPGYQGYTLNYILVPWNKSL